jgi:hypothetical protein
VRARILIPVAVALVAVLGVGVAVAAIRRDKPTRYQQALQSKVENSRGVPKAGLDPAKEKQTSLFSAARKPNDGAGQRGIKPARALKLRKLRRSPDAVLNDDPGEVLGGCLAGYGTPGEQCLPARAPRNKPLTCTYAAKLFPKGIRITSHPPRDRLRLDTDRDGIACDPGDRGARASSER